LVIIVAIATQATYSYWDITGGSNDISADGFCYAFYQTIKMNQTATMKLTIQTASPWRAANFSIYNSTGATSCILTEKIEEQDNIMGAANLNITINFTTTLDDTKEYCVQMKSYDGNTVGHFWANAGNPYAYGQYAEGLCNNAPGFNGAVDWRMRVEWSDPVTPDFVPPLVSLFYNDINNSAVYPAAFNTTDQTVTFNVTNNELSKCRFATTEMNYTAMASAGADCSNNVTSSISGICTDNTARAYQTNQTFYVSCIDDAGNMNLVPLNNSNKIIFNYVDDQKPAVTLNTPLNNTRITTSYYNMSYNATDNNNPTLACNLTLDGTNTFKNTTSGAMTNITLSLTQGWHYWNTTCTDNSGNQNASYNRLFLTDSISPSITLNVPSNGVTSNNTQYNFTWTTTDNIDTATNCSLRLDATTYPNQATLNNTLTNRTINVTETTHYWNVTCTDNGNLTNTSLTNTFVIDRTAPNATNNSISYSGTVCSEVFTCNLQQQPVNVLATTHVTDPSNVSSVVFAYDATSIAMIPAGDGSTYTRTVLFSPGNHSYYFQSTDSLGNVGSTTVWSFLIYTMTGVDVAKWVCDDIEEDVKALFDSKQPIKA